MQQALRLEKKVIDGDKAMGAAVALEPQGHDGTQHAVPARGEYPQVFFAFSVDGRREPLMSKQRVRVSLGERVPFRAQRIELCRCRDDIDCDFGLKGAGRPPGALFLPLLVLGGGWIATRGGAASVIRGVPSIAPTPFATKFASSLPVDCARAALNEPSHRYTQGPHAD